MRTRVRIVTAAAVSATASGFALVTASLVTAPAYAGAAEWRGKSEQGRKTYVRTGADGLVKRAGLRWRARCGEGRFVTGTFFKAPLDSVTPQSFEDAGSYRTRLDDGLRAVVRVRIRGTLSADLRRWSGTFRGRASIRRDGRQIDSCRVRGVSWRARLRD
jgi:hypothetical protein